MKRFVTYLLVIALLAGACTGGFFLYERNRRENTYVEVIPVDYISTYDYGSSTNLSGVTVNHQSQMVILDSSRKIEEIFVKEGQTVKIGEPLIQLDSTMNALELEDMRISLEKKKLELQNAGARLDKLLRTKPGGSHYDPGWDDPGWWDPFDPWEEPSSEEESSEEESTEEKSSEEESSEEVSSEKSTEETSSEETSEEETSSGETTGPIEPVTKPEETTPQETSPQETTPQETTPQETTLQETTPQETSPQETTPQETTPQETTLQETTPQETSPQETTPQETTPQETSPQETTPQETTPQETTPQETTPQETTVPETTTEEEPTAADGQPLIGSDIVRIDQKRRGTGTKEDPFIFLCGANARLNNALVRQLIRNRQYAVLYFYNEAGIRDYDMDLSALIVSEEGEPIIHTHDYLEVSRREPSCLSAGQITYQCQGCGDRYTADFGELTAHTNVLILSRPANCVARGYDIYQCSVCGNTEILYTPVLTGQHAYVLVLDGGTTGRYHYYQCSICGESLAVDNPNYTAPTQPAAPESSAGEPQSGSQTTASIRDASIRHGRSLSSGLNLPSENNEDFSYMTADELAAEIASQRTTIRDLDLEYRKMELQYHKKEKEVDENSVIYSTVNGVIEQLQTGEDIDFNEPVMTINGAEGMYVRGTVGENMLGTFLPGTQLACSSWTMNGMISCIATVTEVSEYPASENMSGYGNPNLSYYPFVAYIEKEDCQGLESGSWVDISLDTQGDMDALFIEQMYVLKEANRYYVYVRNPQTTLLEKRYVTIGKTLYDTYCEIKSGLSREDMIAVPFGKEVREGVKTRLQGEEGGQDVEIPSGDDIFIPGEDMVFPEEDMVFPEEDMVFPEEDMVIPGDGAVIPQDGMVIPQDGNIIPEDGMVMPEEGMVLPEDGAVMPEDGIVMPEEEIVMPEDGIIMPEDGMVMPEDDIDMPEVR